MRLSQHFTLAELTRSATAQRLGLDNTPPPKLIPRLVRTAEMLERVRSTVGCPVIVTSGYRSPAVNAAVGSRSTSDHTQGHAADIVAPGFGTPTEVARLLAPLVSVLGIGQLILEQVGGKSWVHVSTYEPERAINRIITVTDAGTLPGIVSAA